MNPTRLLCCNLLLIFILIQASCGDRTPEQKADATHEHSGTQQNQEDIVSVSHREMEEFGIVVDTAGPGSLEMEIRLPGEIVVPPDNLAHIHPRFPGMVKEVRKHIGDNVREGEVLAVIEGNESLAEYEVRSLIDGTIVEKHLTRGEIIEGAEHGFIIADLSTVWVLLRLYQKDFTAVRAGQIVTIDIGKGYDPVKGRISYITPMMNEATRTAEGRVVLRNPSGTLRPGMFVTGIAPTSTDRVPIAVPRSAIEQLEGQPVVFVRQDGGFVPRPVHIGRRGDITVEIIHGIEVGDVYVRKGGFTLKAEMTGSSSVMVTHTE